VIEQLQKERGSDWSMAVSVCLRHTYTCNIVATSRSKGIMSQWEFMHIFWYWYKGGSGGIMICPRDGFDTGCLRQKHSQGWKESDPTRVYDKNYPAYLAIEVSTKNYSEQQIIVDVINCLGMQNWESTTFEGDFSRGSAWFKRPLLD
jgi:hypothetical protein